MSKTPHNNNDTVEIISPIFRQFVIIISLVAFLILGISFYINFKNEKQILVQNTKTLVESISASLVNSLGTGAHLDVDRLLSGVVKLRGINHIYILDENDDLEFAYPEKEMLYRKSSLLDVAAKLNLRKYVEGLDYHVFEASSMLVIHKTLAQFGQPSQWRLVITYSLGTIGKNILMRLAKFLFFVLIVVFGVFLLFKLTFEAKLKSISNVLEQINSISKGNYQLNDIPTPIKGKLRNFVLAFNRMKKSIIRNQIEIKNSINLISIGQSTAMVAHDVRRPMASMKAILRILPEIKDDPVEIEKKMTEVNRNIAHTEQMLDEVLDFSRDATALNKDEVDPQVIICSAICDAVRNHSGCDISIKYDLKHRYTLDVDGARIIRVLTNIIDNAIGAMKNGKDKSVGNLWVKTEGCQTSTNDDRILITISDNGPGIPEEVLPKIFDPFFTYGKKGGTGLGLAICYKVISMHEGRIEARNRKRGDDSCGAEFIIELPMGKKEIKTKTSELINHSDELKIFHEEETKRIEYAESTNIAEFLRINKERQRQSYMLIVDDEPLFRETTRRLLNKIPQAKDHVVIIEADSGETGIKACEERKFDYIITDIDLGEGNMNGYEFAMKMISKLPTAHILIHSNKRREELDKKIRNLKSDKFMGFLRKPMEVEELVQFLACKTFESQGQGLGSQEQEARKTKKVLVVNDDPVMLSMYKFYVKRDGVQLLEASCVSDALKFLVEHKVDIILSDLNLGEGEPSGYDLLKEVRSKNKDMPFYIVSGYSKSREEPKALELGATAYLQHPVDEAEMEKIIN